LFFDIYFSHFSQQIKFTFDSFYEVLIKLELMFENLGVDHFDVFVRELLILAWRFGRPLQSLQFLL